MQIIRNNPTAERRARATIAFTGAAGAGAVGTVTIFTITGRVFVTKMTAFCTENLAEAAATATIQIGTSSDTDAFFQVQNAVDIDVNEWMCMAAAPAPGAITVPTTAANGYSSSQVSKALSESVIATIGAQNVTDGTIVFDVWYFPLTDNGALA